MQNSKLGAESMKTYHRRMRKCITHYGIERGKQGDRRQNFRPKIVAAAKVRSKLKS